MLWRKARAIVLISVLLLALFADMTRPRPASAGNLGIVIGASIGIFLVVIAAGTWWVYGRKYKPESELMPDYEQPLAMRGNGEEVQFAPHCRTMDGHVPIACW